MGSQMNNNSSGVANYNLTQLFFDEMCIDVPGPTFQRLYEINNILQVYFTPICTGVGLLGNIISFIVFMTNSRLKHQSCSIYLASLALADMGYLVFLKLPWALHVSKSTLLAKSPAICQIMVYMMNVCGFLSTWLVVSITVERYIVVCHPLQRRRLCTKTRAKITVACLTVFAWVLYIYTVWTTGVFIDPETNSTMCYPKPNYQELVEIMAIQVEALIMMIIPSIIIVSLNAIISIQIFHFLKRRATMTHQARNAEIPDIELATQNGTRYIQSPTTASSKCHQQVMAGTSALLTVGVTAPGNLSLTQKSSRSQLNTPLLGSQGTNVSPLESPDRPDVISASTSPDGTLNQRPCDDLEVPPEGGVKTKKRISWRKPSRAESEEQEQNRKNARPTVLEFSAREHFLTRGHAITVGVSPIRISKANPSEFCRENGPRIPAMHSARSLRASPFAHERSPSPFRRQMTMNSSSSSKGNGQGSTSQVRVTKMLLVVSTIFVLLNLPSHILRLKQLVDRQIDPNACQSLEIQMWLLLTVFIYHFRFSINFFLYNICAARFRSALKEAATRAARFSCGTGFWRLVLCLCCCSMEKCRDFFRAHFPPQPSTPLRRNPTVPIPRLH